MRYGLVYARPWIYDALLYLLYRGRPRIRFQRVAEEIPPGSSVLDLCAGTAMLYSELREKHVQYTALDVNPRLVSALERQGIRAICCDVRHAELPEADVVVMNSSLYHFGPDVADILRKMADAARNKVVILEPVQNLGSSRAPWIERFARFASTVEGTRPSFYFTAESFSEAVRSAPGLATIECLSDGRDMLAVLRAGAGADPRE